ncbi:MAG: GNAT family N-acetyltransferase [Fodinibius sp.]|nr:GNAT family N-acetyltransferase [Fodinibius sp.]
MEIRLFQKDDTQQVEQLLQDSVNIVDTEGQTQTSTKRWNANNPEITNWEALFLNKFTIVSEIKDTIVGIAQIEDTGHISCFFCHPKFRRQGIGGQLYSALEDYARSKNIPTIYTECSDTDRPFYLQMEFDIVQKQKVLVDGEVPIYYIVKKDLHYEQ